MRTLTENEKRAISQKHRENTKLIDLPNGGKAVQFYDTMILEYTGDAVTYCRNSKYINQATRRAMKYYTHFLFGGELVIRAWKSDNPVFQLVKDGNRYENSMVNDEVQIEFKR